MMSLDLACLAAWLLCGYGVAFGLINKVPHPAALDIVLGNEEHAACVYCVGFHVGWMTWLANRPVSGVDAIVDCGGWCFAMAAWCYGADAVLRWFEQESG